MTFDFRSTLSRYGHRPLDRGLPVTVQLNVGKLCNQACHHCHVNAGPRRTEIMSPPTAKTIVGLLERSDSVEFVDLTGGAPELIPSFRYLVENIRRLGRRIIVRCNLTVVFEPNMGWLPAFYRDNGVDLVCSLPCYSESNVDAQRGNGVFGKSVRALRLLNSLGYGRSGSELRLDLVYNPVGDTLPPAQEELERMFRKELASSLGIEFHRLLTITNMPISRFAEQLERRGQYDRYMALLVNHFNPSTVEALMCRRMLSVSWDGGLYDCDFNQMLEIPLAAGRPLTTVDDIQSFADLAGTPITTASHCFGCTAGTGSSCGGSLESEFPETASRVGP